MGETLFHSFFDETIAEEREPHTDATREECIDRGGLEPQPRREHGFAEEYRNDHRHTACSILTERDATTRFRFDSGECTDFHGRELSNTVVLDAGEFHAMNLAMKSQ